VLFDVLPNDLFSLIICEWLGSLREYCSLDKALRNKESRSLFIATTSRTATSKICFGETIKINSDKKLNAIMKWKEKRLVEIRKICIIKEYQNVNVDYGLVGTIFTQLKEIELNGCDCKLHNLFNSSLPYLESLLIKNSSIIVNRVALDSIIVSTNIHTLKLQYIKKIGFDGGDVNLSRLCKCIYVDSEMLQIKTPSSLS